MQDFTRVGFGIILFLIIFQNFLSISTLTLMKCFDWKKNWVHFFSTKSANAIQYVPQGFHLSENTESFHKADQQICFYVMTSIRFEAWKKNESKTFYFTGTGNRGFRQSFPKYVESYEKNFFNWLHVIIKATWTVFFLTTI